MKHINGSVVSMRSGKYNRALPDRYDDFTIDTIPDLMYELKYRFVDPYDPSNISSYIGIRMSKLSKEGVGCWSSGDSSSMGKRLKWFRFCAPDSEYVFFIRIPVDGQHDNRLLGDFWVDSFSNKKLNGKIDSLSFGDWLSMAKEELGLK